MRINPLNNTPFGKLYIRENDDRTKNALYRLSINDKVLQTISDTFQKFDTGLSGRDVVLKAERVIEHTGEHVDMSLSDKGTGKTVVSTSIDIPNILTSTRKEKDRYTGYIQNKLTELYKEANHAEDIDQVIGFYEKYIGE